MTAPEVFDNLWCSFVLSVSAASVTVYHHGGRANERIANLKACTVQKLEQDRMRTGIQSREHKSICNAMYYSSREAAASCVVAPGHPDNLY